MVHIQHQSGEEKQHMYYTVHVYEFYRMHDYRQTSYLLVATGIILCEPHTFQDHVNVTVVTSTLLVLATMLLS